MWQYLERVDCLRVGEYLIRYTSTATPFKAFLNGFTGQWEVFDGLINDYAEILPPVFIFVEM